MSCSAASSPTHAHAQGLAHLFESRPRRLAQRPRKGVDAGSLLASGPDRPGLLHPRLTAALALWQQRAQLFSQRERKVCTQLDRTTPQNAALVEESAAAAESLKDQAQRLSAVVATFRLDPAVA